MTKMSDTKMTLSLDSESKRLLRNLTKAIDRLARTKYDETSGASGVKRLSEPAEEPHTIALSPETVKRITEETEKVMKKVMEV